MLFTACKPYAVPCINSVFAPHKNQLGIPFCFKQKIFLSGDRFYARGKVFLKHHFLSRGFGAFSAAVLLCVGLVYEEIQRLNKKLKTLPNETEFARTPKPSAEFLELREAQLNLQYAVKLARSRTTQLAQLASFLPPLIQSPVSVEDELKKLLASFSTRSTDKCTKYFMNVALKQDIKALSVFQKEAVWTFEGNDLLLPQMNREKINKKNIIYLLQALLGHCQIDSNCTEFVYQKGLILLRRILKEHNQNRAIVHSVGRILSMVTLHTWLHQDILKSGWVAIFAEWLRSSDLVLTLLATKSLANMDIEDRGNCFYSDKVYIYHPQYNNSEPLYADVIFVHGLLGGPFKTWRQQDQLQQNLKNNRSANKGHKGQGIPNNITINQSLPTEGESASYTLCWPKDWLAVDCPNLRILTVEYETRLSDWSVGCPYDSDRKTIDVLSRELLVKLEQAGIGKRPIIWIGHSMGGLLIKEMLRIANSVDLLRPLLTQSKGIVFYSVPHKGSSLAGYGRRISYLVYPSIEVRQLMPGSQKLRSLHNSFKELMFEEGIPLLSFAEGQSTNLPFSLQAKIVPEDSSDPGFGEFQVMSQLNHLNICKPENRESELYRLTLNFVQDCLSHMKRPHRVEARK